MRVAVDAMGGDYAPHEPVNGAIKALQRPDPVISQADLLKGIAKERMKEGKTA